LAGIVAVDGLAAPSSPVALEVAVALESVATNEPLVTDGGIAPEPPVLLAVNVALEIVNCTTPEVPEGTSEPALSDRLDVAVLEDTTSSELPDGGTTPSAPVEFTVKNTLEMVTAPDSTTTVP
jgi:hypothetical protein